MKKKTTLFIPVILWCFLAGGLVFTGCTKEGPPGDPGLNGEDATETCMTCHDFSEFLVAKVSQYENSTHASGNNINRSYEGCAQCHTSQGFRDHLADGSLGDISNPTPINCRTCHPIHDSYTPSDYSVRSSAPVTLTLGGEVYDYGNSNLCTNCHQARPVEPFPEFGGPDLTITNQRYGPHYGPQSNMFAGTGAYEIPGSLPYQNSTHTSAIDDGCITCHMSDPIGNTTGGHQMGLQYASYGGTAFNYNGCTSCHQDEDQLAANRDEYREEIMGLQEELKNKLIDMGLLNDSELVPVPLTMTQNEAGAILNYKFVYGDHSYGMHNYLYTKALLVNSLESLN